MDEERIRGFYFDGETVSATGKSLINLGKTDKVIAGEDDRKDVFELDFSDQLEDLAFRLSESTVLLTNKDRLADNGNGTFNLTVHPFRQRGKPPCGGERFANQVVGGWCSGFMIGEDLIATAGHCGETADDIEDTAYVFGFQSSSPTDPGRIVFNTEQVYFGRELVEHELSSMGDYAIVRVDRKITAPGAKALKVRDAGSPSAGTKLGVIGYPSGLPVKIAFGNETVLMRDEDPWLISNLDTYGGNSGSPVFNHQGEVEGILVRGAVDYRFTGVCFRSNRIADSDGSEAVTKASVFQSKIPT